MKKVVFLAFVLGCILAVSTAALAAEELAPTTEGGRDFIVTVTDTQSIKDGKPYLLLILADDADLDSFTVDSILYIDQTVAVENTVTFGPFRLRIHRSATVYIGGASEVLTPYTIAVQGVAVAGTLSVPGAAPGVALGLGSFADFMFAFEAGVAENRFSFETVPAGDYTLKISKPGYLTYYKTVAVGDEPTASLLTAFALPGGDLDGDGVIQFSDLAALLADYGKSFGFLNANSDLDNDGTAQLSDLSLLLAGYGKGSASISELSE